MGELDEIKEKVSKIDEIEKKVSKIDEIEKKVSKIDEIEKKVSKIDEIEKKVSNMEEKVSEIDEIKEKVSVIDDMQKVLDMHTKEFKDMKKVLDVHTKEFKDMKKVQNMHTKELEIIEVEICNHNDTFKEIKAEMKEIKHSLTIVEDAVTNKIPALFEIYSLNYGLQKENEKELKVVKKQEFENSVKINNLENITKEHSKQLKRLIS